MRASRAVNVIVRRSKQPRDYLIEKEIEKLIDAAGWQPVGLSGRHGYPHCLQARFSFKWLKPLVWSGSDLIAFASKKYGDGSIELL
jgi:hypothetical protein